jgi:hypothetical protein
LIEREELSPLRRTGAPPLDLLVLRQESLIEKRERREQGGKLGTRDKEKRGKRERGTDQRDQGNQIGREEREEGAPLNLLSTPHSGAALSKASPCNPP